MKPNLQVWNGQIQFAKMRNIMGNVKNFSPVYDTSYDLSPFWQPLFFSVFMGNSRPFLEPPKKVTTIWANGLIFHQPGFFLKFSGSHFPYYYYTIWGKSVVFSVAMKFDQNSSPRHCKASAAVQRMSWFRRLGAFSEAKQKSGMCHGDVLLESNMSYKNHEVWKIPREICMSSRVSSFLKKHK